MSKDIEAMDKLVNKIRMLPEHLQKRVSNVKLKWEEKTTVMANKAYFNQPTEYTDSKPHVCIEFNQIPKDNNRACEFSGIVREAFRNIGYEAVSCDLRPTELPGPHIQRG